MNKKASPFTSFTFADYSQLLLETNFIQYGTIKGTIYFTPNSFWLWKQIQTFLEQRFASLGIENVAFPSFISEAELAKEHRHIAGFAPEVLKITAAGDLQLQQPFYLRPTSEVIFSQYFKQILHSYRDLPILLNQWTNVWRWEQNTKPFFRNTEFLWQEGHTLHLNQANALQFGNQIFQIYQDLISNFLFIPVFAGAKSNLEKFAGAKTSWTLEALMPDGQFLQMATTHHLDRNFSKAFQVQFLDQQNNFQHPHQTSWGVSTRLLAGLIMTHMDQYGLRFPSYLSKIQIVVLGYLPVNLNPSVRAKLQTYIDHFCELLDAYRFLYLDVQASKKTLNYWQTYYAKRGVPLQIVIGRLEMERQTISYTIRNLPTQIAVAPLVDWPLKVSTLFKVYNQILFAHAQKHHTDRVVELSSYAAYQKTNPKIAAYSAPFCNTTECELAIKNDTNTTSRLLMSTKGMLKCFRCQTKTQYLALFGRSY